MASLTYLEATDEVLAHCADANVYRARVKRWVNAGVALVSRQTQTRDSLEDSTITTAANDSSYDLPTTFVRVKSLTDTETTSGLVPVDIEEIDDYDASTGRPTCYALDENGLILYPTPNGTYSLRLRYYDTSAELTLDSDPVPFSPPYDQLPVFYATSQLFKAEDDAEMAQFHRAEFDRLLGEYRADKGHQSVDGPRQVGGTWGDARPYPSFNRP